MLTLAHVKKHYMCCIGTCPLNMHHLFTAIIQLLFDILYVAPKRRRIRRMSNESDSEPEPGPAMKKKHVRQISSDDSCSGQQTEEEKINFLAGAFPNIDTEVSGDYSQL